ncbi:hypothetical protein HMPREF1548_00509, partial [Clostridium sp. KLE 1755]
MELISISPIHVVYTVYSAGGIFITESFLGVVGPGGGELSWWWGRGEIC